MHLELAGIESAPQLCFEQHATLQALVHAALEHAVCRPAFILCAIQRDVGVPEQFVMVAAVAREDRNTDACTYANFASVNRNRLADPVDQGRSQPQCLSQIADAFPDDGELVTSEARDEIILGNGGLD